MSNLFCYFLLKGVITILTIAGCVRVQLQKRKKKKEKKDKNESCSVPLTPRDFGIALLSVGGSDIIRMTDASSLRETHLLLKFPVVNFFFSLSLFRFDDNGKQVIDS